MGSIQDSKAPDRNKELSRYLLELIAVRAIVLLLGLNLADRLGILAERIGSFPFLHLFNLLALILTLLFVIFWWIGRYKLFQLYAQICADLILTTMLVVYTNGIESAFVSFYLLIIIYCSLTLGRNGGLVGTALSTLLYAGILAANHLGYIGSTYSSGSTPLATFRISAHVIGFWAVAYLGMYLHQRLQIVEWELQEKIDSLTELQRLNEHIVSSIRSGLITTDLQGRIAVFNLAAQELTGRNAQVMIGKSVQELIGDSFWTKILNANLLRNPRALRHEEWIAIPGGPKCYLGFSVSPLLDQSQQLLGYIISFQDLTEITRLEEEVRLKDRMAAIGRMAAGIAHEIRNPLTSMQGSVEILRSRANLPAKDERLLDILVRESDRLNKFVEDFLSFARPRQYAKHPIDLVPVLRDSVTLLRNNPEIRDRHSVNLNIEAQSIRIMGSADQLKQVFWNLAQNSIRAMPNGGELKIDIHRASNETGEIVFQDNGIGMSQEEKNQIFQPFQSGFKGGLGLGLSIIFQIMEDHRGKISFESEKGKGTRVSLRFPLESQVQEPEYLEPAMHA
ncbi:MAG: PAS domain S-box protein [Acidobacteria bacterium]|nr:PAS domain S-box protein [Acidobacteriota bacterium]